MSTLEPVGYVLGGGIRPIALQKGDLLTIGREPQNSVYLDDALASRHHAILETTPDGTVYLKDVGSTNGTWLNEEQLPKQIRIPLYNGDLIRIGGKLLSFISHDPSVEPRRMAVKAAQKLAEMETVAGQLKFVAGEGVQANPDSPKPGENPDLTGTVVRKHMMNNLVATQHEARSKSGKPEPALAGQLSEQNLAQVVQFLNMTSKTGELRVRGKVLEGMIAFKQGHPFFGEAGSHKGVQAIYACAREREGSFRFHSTEQPPERAANITEPVMHIIFECCKRIDETRLQGM